MVSNVGVDLVMFVSVNTCQQESLVDWSLESANLFVRHGARRGSSRDDHMSTHACSLLSKYIYINTCVYEVAGSLPHSSPKLFRILL